MKQTKQNESSQMQQQPPPKELSNETKETVISKNAMQTRGYNYNK
jgi:hypothetical protein